MEKDILRNLDRESRTYEGLKELFPASHLDDILIKMEEHHLVENRNGTWAITPEGKKKITRGKNIFYSLLVVPIICFFLLSAYFYAGYTGLYNENDKLSDRKTEAVETLSDINERKEAAEAAYNAQVETLAQEQEKTDSLNDDLERAEESTEPIEEEVAYFEFLETSSPDNFVTVDNPYVRAQVDEITAGLINLKEKQTAVFEFVRDEITFDEDRFRFGRLDMWEYPEDILKRGSGHFEDKYLLLVTMLRMVGTPPNHVKFIAAEVDGNDKWAWVEAYDGDTWWVLDPFEGYEFTDQPKDGFYDEHEVVILWWFNDTGFWRG
jgi:hypothetical protein